MLTTNLTKPQPYSVGRLGTQAAQVAGLHMSAMPRFLFQTVFGGFSVTPKRSQTVGYDDTPYYPSVQRASMTHTGPSVDEKPADVQTSSAPVKTYTSTTTAVKTIVLYVSLSPDWPRHISALN